MHNRIGWQVIIWWYTLGQWKGPHLWSLWTRDQYVTFSLTYKLASCLIKVMVIKWNVCPGVHGNLFSSTQACGLDIGPHIVKPGLNTTWWRFANIVLNYRIWQGGQRVWSPLAEHPGNSKKPFIWLLSHIFLKFCSWYCLIFHFHNLSITYVLANVIFNFVNHHMQPLSHKYYCLSFFFEWNLSNEKVILLEHKFVIKKVVFYLNFLSLHVGVSCPGSKNQFFTLTKQ